MSQSVTIPVVHYQSTRVSEAACGRGRNRTTDVQEVTCQRCQTSGTYRNAVARFNISLGMAHREKQEYAQSALDAFLAKAHEVAKREGYCDAYDNVIDEASLALPDGVTVTPRSQDFEVEIEWEATIRYTTTVTVEAASEDDASEQISEDPESHYDADLQSWAPSNGYVNSIDFEITSTSAS